MSATTASSATGASSSVVSSTMATKGPELELRVSDKHTCLLCDSIFESYHEQREHGKGGWHIYNLQRKIDGLPPVDEEAYEEEVDSSRARREQERLRPRVGLRGDEAMVRRYIVSRRGGVSTSSESGSFESESLESEQSISAQEESTESEDEEGEEDEPRRIGVFDGGRELRLENGKIVGNKETRRERRKRLSRHEEPHALTHVPPPRPHNQVLTQQYLSECSPSPTLANTERRLAKRDLMGVVGLDEREKKALLATERKMVTLEVRDKGGYQAGVDWKGNCQKHYRIGGSRGGKKMGGLEKRLG